MTYQPFRWFEFNGSYSRNRARYKTPYDDGTGHVGEFVPNAPFATGSFAAYLKELGHWSGALEYRYLSGYPLSSDDVVKGSGYGEWNGDLRYDSALAGWLDSTFTTSETYMRTRQNSGTSTAFVVNRPQA